MSSILAMKSSLNPNARPWYPQGHRPLLSSQPHRPLNPNAAYWSPDPSAYYVLETPNGPKYISEEVYYRDYYKKNSSLEYTQMPALQYSVEKLLQSFDRKHHDSLIPVFNDWNRFLRDSTARENARHAESCAKLDELISGKMSTKSVTRKEDRNDDATKEQPKKCQLRWFYFVETPNGDTRKISQQEYYETTFYKKGQLSGKQQVLNMLKDDTYIPVPLLQIDVEDGLDQIAPECRKYTKEFRMWYNETSRKRNKVMNRSLAKSHKETVNLVRRMDMGGCFDKDKNDSLRERSCSRYAPTSVPQHKHECSYQKDALRQRHLGQNKSCTSPKHPTHMYWIVDTPTGYQKISDEEHLQQNCSPKSLEGDIESQYLHQFEPMATPQMDESVLENYPPRLRGLLKEDLIRGNARIRQFFRRMNCAESFYHSKMADFVRRTN